MSGTWYDPIRLEGRTFTSGRIAKDIISDPSFKYTPNETCHGCKKLLRGALLTPAQLIRYYIYDHNLDAVILSAAMGCHLCSLFERCIYSHLSKVLDDQLLAFENIDSTLQSWSIRYQLTKERRKDNILCNFDISVAKPGKEWSRLSGAPVGVILGVLSAPRGDQLPSLGVSTGDDDTFQVARKWLDSCITNHSECHRDDHITKHVKTPARLLLISVNNGKYQVKLIDNDDEVQKEYVTLSHCWGPESDKTITLTQNHEAAMRDNVEWTFLTHTFRDAVVITQKMGYCYLWIDALCIFQDSKNDWLKQSATMSLVYAHSAFTIAALNSVDGSGGCFTHRNPLALRPLETQEMGTAMIIEQQTDWWFWEVDGFGEDASPLHTRGWVVQERLSSPRTLYYGKLGIYWECCCLRASELHSVPVSVETFGNKKTIIKKLKEVSATIVRLDQLDDLDSWGRPISDRWNQSFFGLWSHLVGVYSACSFSHSTDKLIAISGLVNEIREHRPRPYMQGLWGPDWVESLSWLRYTDGQGASRPGIGLPSWTWASIQDRVHYPAPSGIVEWQAVVEPIRVGGEHDEITEPTTLKLFTARRRVVFPNSARSYEKTTFVIGSHLDVDDEAYMHLGGNPKEKEDLIWKSDECISEMILATTIWAILLQRTSRLREGEYKTVSRFLIAKHVRDNMYSRIGIGSMLSNNLEESPFGAEGSEVFPEEELILI